MTKLRTYPITEKDLNNQASDGYQRLTNYLTKHPEETILLQIVPTYQEPGDGFTDCNEILLVRFQPFVKRPIQLDEILQAILSSSRHYTGYRVTMAQIVGFNKYLVTGISLDMTVLEQAADPQPGRNALGMPVGIGDSLLEAILTYRRHIDEAQQYATTQARAMEFQKEMQQELNQTLGLFHDLQEWRRMERRYSGPFGTLLYWWDQFWD